jgi:hypothetical protein
MSHDPYAAPLAVAPCRHPQSWKTRRISVFLTVMIGLCCGVLAGVAWCVVAWGGAGRDPMPAAWLVGLIIAPAFGFSACVRLLRTGANSGHLFIVTCAVAVVVALSIPLRFHVFRLLPGLQSSIDSPWLFALANGPLPNLPLCVLPTVVLFAFDRITLRQAILLVMTMCPFVMIGFGELDAGLVRSLRSLDPNPLLFLFPASHPVNLAQNAVRVSMSGLSVLVLSGLFSHAFDTPPAATALEQATRQEGAVAS